jgi:hypothetical protein
MSRLMSALRVSKQAEIARISAWLRRELAFPALSEIASVSWAAPETPSARPTFSTERNCSA